MGYVTTQYHNLKARFVFDIRSLSVSIWKSPRQWLKFNFYNWLHWQIGAVEIMWHRLPSRRPTQRALDVCPECFDTGYRRVSPTILAKCSCKHGQRQ